MGLFVVGVFEGGLGQEIDGGTFARQNIVVDFGGHGNGAEIQGLCGVEMQDLGGKFEWCEGFSVGGGYGNQYRFRGLWLRDVFSLDGMRNEGYLSGGGPAGGRSAVSRPA